MKRPNRSPIEIPELVKKYLYGKTFCEIGCCEGDLLEQFAKYADKAIGIEISRSYKDKLLLLEKKYKNIEIIMGNFFDIEIPICDVYYFWIMPEYDAELIKILPNTLIIHKALFNKPWLENEFNKYEHRKIEYINFVSDEEPNWPRPKDNITKNTPLVIGILHKEEENYGQ